MSQHFLNMIRKGQTAEIASAVEESPDLARARDAQGVSALMLAVYTGQPMIRDYLREKAGELDIWEAAALGDNHRLHILIASNAMIAREVYGDGWPPLHLAAAFASAETVTLLLEHGAHIHQISHNPLRNHALHACIALHGSVESVRVLLDAGADVNATAAGGYSPLHQAAAAGKSEVVRLLLQNGAKKDATCDQGKLALDYARERNHLDAAALLVG
jgi:uncharacterized protein